MSSIAAGVRGPVLLRLSPPCFWRCGRSSPGYQLSACSGWFPAAAEIRIRPMARWRAAFWPDSQLRDPILFQVLLDSAVFGLQVACGLLLIAWLAGLGFAPASRATWRRWLRPVAELPPLVLGVGVLAVPWLAALASRLLLDRGHEHAAVLVGNLAAAIDTREHPFILMAGAVGLVLLPRFFGNRGA